MFRRILMCKPQHFDVFHYKLNDHMLMQRSVNKKLASTQWEGLVNKILNKRINIDMIKPEKNLVDMVFAANVGLIHKKNAFISNFTAVPRRHEHDAYKKYFSQNDYNVITLPKDMKFEGAGDALFSHNKTYLWIGHGFRTDKKSVNYIRDSLSIKESIQSVHVISLKLVDPLFYHLDTCFCPLSNGSVMIYKPAFSDDSLDKIYTSFGESGVIAVSSTDAKNFACNSIYSDADGKKNIIGHKYSNELKNRLEKKGYVVEENNMSEFLLSGGSTKCSILDLD